ncbi:hypothetical protein URH17368_2390 [Alicyclobacillus hesperidum URH17-3-68]|uniref:Anti-sigma-28 factor, FlgM n=1 Tax=Alicyclobacillus hesperidum TaxID=89784 RepID=A0A1H2WJ16_9BACL|nr:flagellar biosynthesis anti-sigma factor FlgM [Alicyclobacillus hesperidum]EJY54912.1 hypothetical protein URH17368_2390 [Alicyclobacillus hesperidum URH17-3-68]GLV13081.1 hypothetical protein Heshes_07650 [Alicyclobacillus hesperidum]SDW80009.1 Anti-sigma-28 factor, FlgM [Alicyclobacillus hesperidum]
MWSPSNSFDVTGSRQISQTASSQIADASRSDKIRQLQEAIRNGTYTVNVNHIAKAIVQQGVLNSDG